MTDSTPSFVLRQGASAADWVEWDDRLPQENQASAYDERNQQDWWERNKKIRELFDHLEKQIRHLVSAGEIPSTTLVSWSKLARKLNCNRATFKHPRRKHWVSARHVELLILITNAKQEARLSLEPTQPKISELEELRQSLSAQRTQTGIVYDKCIRLEQDVAQLRRLLAVRDTRIKELLANTY